MRSPLSFSRKKGEVRKSSAAFSRSKSSAPCLQQHPQNGLETVFTLSHSLPPVISLLNVLPLTGLLPPATTYRFFFI